MHSDEQQTTFDEAITSVPGPGLTDAGREQGLIIRLLDRSVLAVLLDGGDFFAVHVAPGNAAPVEPALIRGAKGPLIGRVYPGAARPPSVVYLGVVVW